MEQSTQCSLCSKVDQEKQLEPSPDEKNPGGALVYCWQPNIMIKVARGNLMGTMEHCDSCF